MTDVLNISKHQNTLKFAEKHSQFKGKPKITKVLSLGSFLLAIQYAYVYVCAYVRSYLSLCIGVFSDVLNLIFRDKSSFQITSDGVKVVGNVDLKSDKMQQREDVLSKCLQFLRLLARYTYV